MTIYLDSANIEHIKEIMHLQLATGITTNPSILLKSGVRRDELDSTYSDIMKLTRGDVSVELLNFEVSEDELLAEAREYGVKHHTSFTDMKLVIKVPFVYPKGVSLIAKMRELGIPVNATCIMSAHQAILAIQQKPRYISFFYNRMKDYADAKYEEIAALEKTELNGKSDEDEDESFEYETVYASDIEEEVLQEIALTRRYIDINDLNTKIICGSIREIYDIQKCLDYGAHIVTVPYKILIGMLNHPKTDEAVDEFTAAALKL